ncbi:glycerophosphodiester phosphodiesterase [Methanococcoides sp. SA1]|nr:glycerophosphodiester phosphodiesterase [Methanococcoides sp. SA1]
MDYEDIFSRSWTAFKDNVAAFIIATIIVIFGSIFVVTIAPLLYGLTYMAMKGLRGEKVEINDVFKGFDRFVKSWVLLLVSIILINIGFMLLILPGMILSILLIYSLPLLVIKDYGAMDAIKESIEISKQNFVDSLVLLIIVAIISAIGGITYIGSLVTTPIITLALVAAVNTYVGNEGIEIAEYTDVSDIDDGDE